VIRVVIADDHAVVRTGLTQLVRSAEDLELVGVAEDGDEAVTVAVDQEAHVVLMDLSMPRMDGAAATRLLLERRPDAQVVILTSFSDRDRILEALDAGAVGYLLKDAEPDAVLEGIRAAARGESPLAPKAARALLAERADRGSAPELSDREQEVLALVGEGLPNKLIARRLDISEKTVKAHLTRVFRELGVDDRTQAALWAREHLSRS
jgi:DNA-binding NarL/FixJ family response regulator